MESESWSRFFMGAGTGPDNLTSSGLPCVQEPPGPLFVGRPQRARGIATSALGDDFPRNAASSSAVDATAALPSSAIGSRISGFGSFLDISGSDAAVRNQLDDVDSTLGRTRGSYGGYKHRLRSSDVEHGARVVASDIIKLLPGAGGSSSSRATAFLFGFKNQPDNDPEVDHAKVCYFYPGEDPDKEVFEPPRPDETIHKVQPLWIWHKLKKMYRMFIFFAYGITIGIICILGKALIDAQWGKPAYETEAAIKKKEEDAHKKRKKDDFGALGKKSDSGSGSDSGSNKGGGVRRGEPNANVF